MAKGSAAKKNVIPLVEPPQKPVVRVGMSALELPILAVKFARGCALQIPGMGNAFESIDLRPLKHAGGGTRPSKHAGIFTLAVSGPLLMIGYTRPDGVRCVEGYPIVGNVRQISFDPAG